MGTKKIKYSDAIAEIEEIVSQIESEELDVDDLSDKVKRAYFLLNYCKEKLYNTEVEVLKIMKDFSENSD